MRNNYNLPTETFLLYKSLTLGDNQIMRDYKELEFLQSSAMPPYRFAGKLREIICDKISNKLLELFPSYGLIINNKIIKKTPQDNYYIIVNLITEQNNLLRALPFISSNAIICKISDLEKKQQPQEIITSIVTNPILNLLYWSSNVSKGSYEKNNRIKTSKISNIDDASGIDYNHSNGINFNSAALELSFLAAGKFDFIKKKFHNYYELIAAQYIAENAGAVFNIDYDKKIMIAAANNFILKKIT